MGIDDKLENTKEEGVGKVKETIGAATDDKNLENQGRNDQAKSKLKQMGEDVKDAAAGLKDKADDLLHDAKDRFDKK